MSAPEKLGPLLDVSEWPKGSGNRWGTCPGCGTRGRIDAEQYRGEVSIVCPSDGCDYHETHDHRKADE